MNRVALRARIDCFARSRQGRLPGRWPSGGSILSRRAATTPTGEAIGVQHARGALFRSAEDTDFSMRALWRGFAVYETTQGHVVHSGFRAWDDRDRVAYDCLCALGATFAKHLKRRQPSVLLPMGRRARRWAAETPVVDLARTPPRLLRLHRFTAAFLMAAGRPVDARSTRFIANAEGR